MTGSRRSITRPSARGVRALTVAALALLWAIVPSGAAVRLTSSGLGCSDWPTCEGNQVVPATSAHALIESTNRILSAVVALVAIITFVAAWRSRETGRTVTAWTGAAALCTVGQVPLGAITVATDLHPMAVGAHFLLSMLALAAGAVAVLVAFDAVGHRVRRWNRRQGPMALIALAAAAATLVTGVLVTAAGPHSGDDDVLDRFGDLPEAARIHVRVAVGFVLLAALLAVWVWRERGADVTARRLALALVPLMALQIGVGEYQYRNGLPEAVVGVHVSLAALVWAVAVALAWAVARPRIAAAPVAAPPPAGSRATVRV
jgi:cytochrome c oxidase assembly protein subunit 15